MNKIANSYTEVKRSKFYGYLYKINNEDEVLDILASVKKENKKAKHIVYAYKIGNIEKKHEDREPSGTAGLPLLNIINLKKLDDTLIVVVRYFGGVLLGRGLLTRTYKETASKLLNKYE